MFSMDLGNLMIHLTAENTVAKKAFTEVENLVSNATKTVQPFTKAVKSAFETAAIASLYAADAIKNYEISAKSVFNSVVSGIKKTAKAFEEIKDAGEKVFKALKVSAEIFIAPLKYVAEAFLAVKSTILAIGMASVKAAGDEEKLHQRLIAIIGDKQRADQMFSESKAMEGYFDIEQIVNARILLEMTGIHGTAAMKSISNAAVALDTDIETVATGLKRMDAGVFRGLWQYGVDLTQEGNQFLFKYRDQMGQIHTIAAQGAAAAQQEMLKIFDLKFGDAFDRAQTTLPGLFRILKESVHDLRVDFGEGLLGPVKLIVGDMIDGIKKLKEGAKSAGENLGDELLKARAGLLAAFDVAYSIAQQIGKVLQNQGIGTVILESIKLGVTLLTDGLMAAFKASISLWKVIGSVLGNAVLEVLYNSGIPGLRGIGQTKREADISRSLGGLSLEQLQTVASPFGISPTGQRESTRGLTTISVPTMESYTKSKGEMLNELSQAMASLPPNLLDKQFQTMSKQLGTELNLDIGYNVNAAIQDAQSSISASLDKLGTQALAALQEYENRIANAAGEKPIDVAKMFNEAYDKNLAEGQQKIQAINNAFKQIQSTVTKGAEAVNVAFTEGERAMRDMLQALKDEEELIGLTNMERERTIALIRFAKVAEQEYGKDTAQYYEKILEYQKELDRLQAKQRGPAAFTVQLKQWAEDASNMWQNLGRITTQALDGMSDAIVDMVNNGKANWQDLGRTILIELQRMIVKMMMARLLMAAFGGFGGGFGGASASGGTQISGMSGETGGSMMAGVAHSGGMVGMINSYRAVPISMFHNAPRLHTGLAPDEFPMIAQQGERITSKADVERERRDSYRNMNITAVAAQPQVTLKVVNVMDKSQMLDAMASPEGEKKIINAFSRNKSVVSGMMR